MILSLICQPVGTCALSYKVDQIHVGQQEDMITQAVPAKHVYVECRIVPYLDYCQSTYHERQKSGARKETILKVTEKSIIPAHHVYENEVVNKLQVLYFFLIFIQKFYHHLTLDCK